MIVTYDGRGPGSGKTHWIIETLVGPGKRTVISLPTLKNLVEVSGKIRKIHKDIDIQAVSGFDGFSSAQKKKLGKMEVAVNKFGAKDAVVNWVNSRSWNGVLVCTHEALVLLDNVRDSNCTLVVDEALSMLRTFRGSRPTISLSGKKLALSDEDGLEVVNISGVLSEEDVSKDKNYNNFKKWVIRGGRNMEAWATLENMGGNKYVAHEIRMRLAVGTLFAGWKHVHVSCAYLETTEMWASMKQSGLKPSRWSHTEDTYHEDAVRENLKNSIVVPILEGNGRITSKHMLAGLMTDNEELLGWLHKEGVFGHKDLHKVSKSMVPKRLVEAYMEMLKYPPLLLIDRAALKFAKKQEGGMLIFNNKGKDGEEWGNHKSSNPMLIIRSARTCMDASENSGETGDEALKLAKAWEDYGDFPGIRMFESEYLEKNGIVIAKSTAVSGLNKGMGQKTVAFLATANISHYDRMYYTAAVPDYNVTKGILGNVMAQCLGRGIHRFGKDGESTVFLVFSRYEAKMVEKTFGCKMAEKPLTNLMYVSRTKEEVREAKAAGGKKGGTNSRKMSPENAAKVNRLRTQIRNAEKMLLKPLNQDENSQKELNRRITEANEIIASLGGKPAVLAGKTGENMGPRQ